MRVGVGEGRKLDFEGSWEWSAALDGDADADAERAHRLKTRFGQAEATQRNATQRKSEAST
jgi:hypothetical protein